MKKLLLSRVMFAVTLVLFPALAFAQAAPEVTGGQMAQQVLDAIGTGKGWAIAGVIVSALTWALRKGVLNQLPWPAAVTWLHDHPAAGFATPFVLSALGGLFTSLAAGGALNWGNLAMDVLKVGVTAIGTFVAMKTVTESHDVGKVAAAAVVTKTDAIDLLKGGPQQ